MNAVTDEQTDVFGFVCDRCGLSDVGRERLTALGFQLHPCNRCRNHHQGED